MSKEWIAAQNEPLLKKEQITKNIQVYSIIQVPLYTYHNGKKSRINTVWKSCTECNGYVGFRHVVATTFDKTAAIRLLRYYNRYSKDYHYMYAVNYLTELKLQ